MSRVTVGVMPGLGFAGLRPLFEALQTIAEAKFESRTDLEPGHGLGGVVILDGDRRRLEAARRTGVPAFWWESAGAEAVTRRSPEVRFSSAPALDPCLRGQRLEDDRPNFRALAVEAGEEAMATMEGRPFWVRGESGGVWWQRSSLPLPVLSAEDCLLRHFRLGQFAGLLPLLHFARDVARGKGISSPRHRACVVFDDPNLARLRFGCLHFGELARHTLEHGYHAAVATVPLDAGRADPEVVGLFRAGAERLSLLMHGNDHTHMELLQRRTPAAQRSMLAQALRRVAAFERRHGLEVDRVMEAPHGVIRRDLFPTFAELGFEAVLSSPELLLESQPEVRWPVGLGMSSVDWMPGGIAAIPRIRLRRGWQTAVVLAAFQRQPIVVAGHHQDVAQGLEVITELVRLVNRLGSVAWEPMRSISRGLYEPRLEGAELWIRSGQRRVSVVIPEGVESVTLERTWLDNGATEACSVHGDGRLLTGNGDGRVGRVAPSIPVRGTRRLEFVSIPEERLDPAAVAAPRWRLWPYARRILTESRDRLYPVFKRRRTRRS